jgi:hypothetical protein
MSSTEDDPVPTAPGSNTKRGPKSENMSIKGTLSALRSNGTMKVGLSN